MTSSPAAASATSAPLFALGSDSVDVPFPWAGAALLAALAIAAIVARWHMQRRGRLGIGVRLPTWLQKAGEVGAGPRALVVESSLRLSDQAQLHTVRWGDRELLVATSPNASPVLLDSRGASEPRHPE
jgi:hypothetical protein